MKWNRSGKSVLTTIIVLSSDEVMNNEKLERIYEPNLMIGANFWWTVEKRVMAIAFCSLPMRFVWRHEKFWSVVRSLATTQQWTVDEDNVFDDDPFTRPTEQSFIVTHLLIIQSFDGPFFSKSVHANRLYFSLNQFRINWQLNQSLSASPRHLNHLKWNNRFQSSDQIINSTTKYLNTSERYI